MKILFSMFVVLMLGGCFATVGEDGRMVGGGEAVFTLSLPTVLPPLVFVEPGVSVVGDLDDEVFYADGYYWARQDRTWFRSRDHRSGWGRVEDRQVPAVIAQSKPGQYRHYRGNDHERSEQGRHDGHDHG